MNAHKEFDPERLLDQIGVTDLDHGETYTPEHSTTGERGGLMVRGARGGGSFWLNLLSRAVWLLLIAAVAGLGYAGYVFFSGPNGDSAPVVAGQAALPQGHERVECNRRWWWSSPVASSVGEAPSVVLGSASLPTDPQVLEQVGATRHQMEGDVLHVFDPEGAKMAVRYVGNSVTVSSISVRFDESQDVCRALLAVGLLPEDDAFAVTSDGWLYALDNDHPFFSRGGAALMLWDGEEVAGVQLQQQ